MATFTPELQLQTLFVLNEHGRIISTREPMPSRGPRFSLIRGRTECAWAIHADVPDAVATELHSLARDEPASTAYEHDPVHAARYVALLGGRVDAGPAFTFPTLLPRSAGIVAVSHLAQLEHHFRGWTADELPERAPILAVVEEGYAVSVCFCARRTDAAAEAGVETAQRSRRRGLSARVTAAWALAIRSTGRIPLYSTAWNNAPSLALARKLGLEVCASDWNLY